MLTQPTIIRVKCSECNHKHLVSAELLMLLDANDETNIYVCKCGAILTGVGLQAYKERLKMVRAGVYYNESDLEWLSNEF